MIDQPGLIDAIDRLADRRSPAMVNNVNVHACNLAYEQAEFHDVLNSSEIVFCDGFGVKLAGWLTRQKLGERMTPPDWIDDLFQLCQHRGYRVFFLGDEERVVKLFVDEVRGRSPNLQIAGYHHGFFDLAGRENQVVMEKIAAADADIILTGMGMPRQELWARDAMLELDKGLFIATGALFRWYTGFEKRAPRWMTDHGLEWLARLVTQPRRLFRRYVIGLPLFYGRVIRWHWLGNRKGAS
jgi:N-acetylglucosaminyldiphosphoundecaprenol N-acetyl-beta-D-mannosaminyltransferase